VPQQRFRDDRRLPPDEPDEPEEGDPGERPSDDDRENPFGPFALVVLLVLIVGGLLVIFALRDMASLQDCVWSGRKNCAPIETR